jgi:AcrR family transcriptional regulator
MPCTKATRTLTKSERKRSPKVSENAHLDERIRRAGNQLVKTYLTNNDKSVKIVGMNSNELETSESTGKSRRDKIVDSAIRAFLRFGFKKTSMDAVALAAGISRQALYLHFPNKESLFSEVVNELGRSTGRVARVALCRTELTLEEQLLAAFDETLPRESPELLAELLATAKALVPESVADIDAQMVAEISARLHAAFVDVAWSVSGVSIEQAVQVLQATSYGLKQQSGDRHDYLAGMRSAIRLILKAGGLVPPIIQP